MKKTILLSLVVTSLVMGANMVDNLKINQANEITSSSTIDNATVDQGKTEVLGTSDVDNVTIGTTANLIKNRIIESSIKETTTDGTTTTVSQGFTKIDASMATDLLLDTTNKIENIDITNTVIQQGGLTVEGGSELKDMRDTKVKDLESTNIISNTTADATAVDINGKKITQGMTVVSGTAKAKNLLLLNTNIVNETTVDNSEIHQSNLKIDGSGTEVTTLTVGGDDDDGNTYKNNEVLNSEIGSDSVIKQNDITIQNGSKITTLTSKTKNTINGFKADKSLISQNELFIDDSIVTSFTTTQTNTITGTTVDNAGVITYNSWSNTSDENRPAKTSISQGATTIN